MRFVLRDYIPSNAVLAKPIMGAKNEVLLREGVELQQSYIRRLKDLGIAGVYINDSISEDLNIISALADEVRTDFVKNILTIFTRAAQNQLDTRSSSILVMRMAETIVEELLEHDNGMPHLIDIKVCDNYTYFHCVNVAVLAVVIGMGMDYNRDRLIELAYAGLVHDIGKMFIDGGIINKAGPLSPAELEIVKKHPLDGYNYIKEKFYSNVPDISARGVLDHHERVDGSGYPSGKRRLDIVEFGRILAIADVYDALTSDRPYRRGVSAVEAMEFIQGSAGTLFDYNIVSIFARRVAIFPVGTCVTLSNGTTGLVMENYEGFTQRPMLKIFMRDGKPVTPYLFNMRNEEFDTTVVTMAEI